MYLPGEFNPDTPNGTMCSVTVAKVIFWSSAFRVNSTLPLTKKYRFSAI